MRAAVARATRAARRSTRSRWARRVSSAPATLAPTPTRATAAIVASVMRRRRLSPGATGRGAGAGSNGARGYRRRPRAPNKARGSAGSRALNLRPRASSCWPAAPSGLPSATADAHRPPRDRAHQALCTELLTAAELKTLCQTRGFPTTGTSKDALAEAAAARLLEPAGVARAMAALEPRWLRALHVIAAADKPVPLLALLFTLTPARSRVRIDMRAFWREVTAGLLAHGVALAVDSNASSGNRSRYDRLSLVLPESFVAQLPPFPIAATAVAGAGVQGDLDEMLTAALTHFVRGDPRGADTVTLRIAAMLHIKQAHLHLEGVDRPDAAQVAQCVRAVHRGSLEDARGIDDDPGAFALHILTHLPPETACDAGALADALTEIALRPAPGPLTAFLDGGARAGVLTRFDRAKQPPLYRAAASPPAPSRMTLQLTATAKGVAVAPAGSGLLPVLQAASVARARSPTARSSSSPTRCAWAAAGTSSRPRCRPTSSPRPPPSATPPSASSGAGAR